MVIIHADARVATNLNRFDQIYVTLAPSDSTWRLTAERDISNINGSYTVRKQLGRFDTEKQALEQFEIITKEWGRGRRTYDMRIPIAFYNDQKQDEKE